MAITNFFSTLLGVNSSNNGTAGSVHMKDPSRLVDPQPTNGNAHRSSGSHRGQDKVELSEECGTSAINTTCQSLCNAMRTWGDQQVHEAEEDATRARLEEKIKNSKLAL